MQVLRLQGQEIVSPDQRSGLHPLAIPLSKGRPLHASQDDESSTDSDEVYTCLLRWPASAATQVAFKDETVRALLEIVLWTINISAY